MNYHVSVAATDEEAVINGDGVACKTMRVEAGCYGDTSCEYTLRASRVANTPQTSEESHENHDDHVDDHVHGESAQTQSQSILH